MLWIDIYHYKYIKSVNNIKSISPTRRDLIIKKRYMQLINKYNLENKWINL